MQPHETFRNNVYRSDWSYKRTVSVITRNLENGKLK